jgi:CRISPR-associated protein Csb2
LQWLLGRGAPQLSVSEGHRRFAPDVHMPTNPHPDEKGRKATLGLLPAHRKKAALPIPAVIPDEAVAYLLWPEAEPDEHLETLRTICHGVTYLGRSRSLVQVIIVDGPPPPTHVPDPMGQVQLRVPGEERLGYLRAKYKHDGGQPAPCLPQRYRRTDQRPRAEKTVHTVFDRCWVFRPQPGDPPLPAISTLKVTQALRKSLISCIDEDQRSRGLEPNVPGIVHGHATHPHCVYAALPFVHPRQRFADGTIKGLAVLVPRGINDDALLTLAQGLMRVQQNRLDIPGVGSWHVEEVPADDPPNATLDPRTWIGVARVWTTATPMVFGHFPKQKKGGEAKVVLDSVEMIGIDPGSVVQIAVDRHSPLYGAPPSWCFKTRKEAGGINQAPSWVRHVTLYFDRPVRGPLVLGSLRYFGLGLMRPMEE